MGNDGQRLMFPNEKSPARPGGVRGTDWRCRQYSRRRRQTTGFAADAPSLDRLGSDDTMSLTGRNLAHSVK